MARIFTAIPRNEDALAGGNQYLLIGRFSQLGPATIDASGYASFAADASAEFTKIVPRQETLQTTETITGNAETGTVFFDQAISFNLAHRTLEKRNNLILMAQNEVIVVVVDTHGTGRVYGATNGMKLDTAPITSGAKWGGELNGYTINFKGSSTQAAPYLTALELADITPSA